MFAHDVTKKKFVNLTQARIIRINQPESNHFTVEAVFGLGESEVVEVLAAYDSYEKAQRSMGALRKSFEVTLKFISL